MPETSEKLTGPGSGLIPLVVVLLLCAMTAGGLWTLHQRYYHDPLNPLQPVDAPAQAQ